MFQTVEYDPNKSAEENIAIALFLVAQRLDWFSSTLGEPELLLIALDHLATEIKELQLSVSTLNNKTVG